MISIQKEPLPGLSGIIKCFWEIDSENDDTIRSEKIIPDGYPEMIFHYKDPFKARFNDKWELQSKYLIAGQIRNYFYLKNTGRTGVFAIKFQPWALTTLFGINMFPLTDKVVSINSKMLKILEPVKNIALGSTLFEDKVSAIENWFLQDIAAKEKTSSKGEAATKLIIKKRGLVNIHEVLQKIGIKERSLERYFKIHIGLSPKFYSRIIRLSYIFSLAQKDPANWSDIIFQAGFYDQSHFIKNFKEFTGEEPTQYGFTEQNMGNFFLNT